MADYAVCLHTNIVDESKTKRLRGETFEATPEWVESVVAGDEAAGRLPRVALVKIPKKSPGRPRKKVAYDA